MNAIISWHYCIWYYCNNIFTLVAFLDILTKVSSTLSWLYTTNVLCAVNIVLYNILYIVQCTLVYILCILSSATQKKQLTTLTVCCEEVGCVAVCGYSVSRAIWWKVRELSRKLRRTEHLSSRRGSQLNATTREAIRQLLNVDVEAVDYH